LVLAGLATVTSDVDKVLQLSDMMPLSLSAVVVNLAGELGVATSGLQLGSVVEMFDLKLPQQCQ
jgi:hypothetical protein